MDLLDELNAVVISPEELNSLLDEAGAWTAEGRGGEDAGLYLVAQHYRGDHIRAFAVYSRLQALAQLVATAEDKRWSLSPLSDGSIPTRIEVVAVAASHPLVRVGNSFSFERSSFFSRVREVAEAEESS
jgi:hypothetical protein